LTTAAIAGKMEPFNRDGKMAIENYDELADAVQEARSYFEEFAGGKKVAAMRARKALQKVRRLAQECRVEIQEIKKGRERSAASDSLIG
jgi:rhamnose utilization protein RhaD (predicted bifunctional aldolase and dehydrogenase)